MDAAINETDEFVKIAKVFQRIPENTTTTESGVYLSSLVPDKARIGEIVEIGTNVGKSAIAFACGLGRLKKKIYTVDIYENPKFEKNVQMAGVANKIEQLVGPSHVIANSFHSKIGLLFIDGDHSYRGTATDIKAWSHKVVKGGYIIFDDFPGHKKSKSQYFYAETNNVGRAVQKYLLSKPYMYKVISDREIGNLLVLEKLKEESRAPRPSLQSRLYWFRRDLRAWAVCLFPSLARHYAQNYKEE